MLTQKQSLTLDIIRSYLKTHEYAPTTQEIAEALGIQSRGVVHRYLKALETQGYIKLLSHQKRNIRLINPVHHSGQASNLEIPLLGAIAAGAPIEAIYQDRTLNLAALFLGPDRYALRIKGDSMIDEGILHDDIIICQKAHTAHAGQIVVALVDHQEATLKRIAFEPPNIIILKPSNAAYQAQRYTQDRIEIQGVFIGLLRSSSLGK